MSDVERICEMNHQRVRWAEEYADVQEPVLQFPNSRERAKARRQAKVMRTASLACAMACGMGTTFLGIGIVEMNWTALITGAIIVLVFLISGYACEIRAEGVEEDV